MCGASDSASKEAQASERERLANVQRSTAAINAAYGSDRRRGEIADYGKAVQAFLSQDLDRNKVEADRNTRFAMARSGLTGGSRDIDVNRELAETYQRGVLDNTRKASGAVATLESQDQQAKNNLIALAQSGMDATTAAQQASEGIRVNLANARADMQQQSVGDLFSKFANIYKTSQEQKGKKEAQRYAGGYDGLYGPVGGYP